MGALARATSPPPVPQQGGGTPQPYYQRRPAQPAACATAAAVSTWLLRWRPPLGPAGDSSSTRGGRGGRRGEATPGAGAEDAVAHAKTAATGQRRRTSRWRRRRRRLSRRRSCSTIYRHLRADCEVGPRARSAQVAGDRRPSAGGWRTASTRLLGDQ